MNRELVLRLLDRSHDLVSTARIDGAIVHDLEGQRLGSVHSVMIDKKSGRVRYAVMLLDGGGETPRIHPLPWGMLNYDPALPGYRVALTPDLLERAPRLTLDEDERPREIGEDELARYYGLSPDEAALPLPIEENDFNSQTV